MLKILEKVAMAIIPTFQQTPFYISELQLWQTEKHFMNKF